MATGYAATALGASAGATADNGVALGRNTTATAINSVALGSYSTTTANLATPGFNPLSTATLSGTASAANGEVSIGSAGKERRLTNLAAGAAPTDAVNVSQLQSEDAKVNGIGAGTAAAIGGGSTYDPATGTILKPTYVIGGQTFNNAGDAITTIGAQTANAVTYDDSTHSAITLGGVGATTPTTLTNVAPGQLSQTSTDAVNGSQLFATNQNVTNLGDTVNNITNGGAGIKYFHANSTLADSRADGTDSVAIGGNAIAGANQSIAMGSNANASAVNSLALGANSTTVADLSAAGFNPGSRALAGTASAANGEVSFGSAGNERRLTNVAAGAAPTDAVNVSQLQSEDAKVNGIGTSTAAATGGGSTYDPTTGAITKPTYVVDGQTFNNTGDAISTLAGQTADAVMYNDSTHKAVTLGGAGSTTPVTLGNVGAGALSATSTDAVNGAQLFTTNQNVANVANTVNNITVNGTGIKYFHANSTLADSVAGGVDAVAIGGNAKASAPNSVALGSNSTTTANLAAAGFNPGSAALSGTASAANGEVSFGSAGKERRLTNVAAGSAATDAVNVSQLQSEDAKVNGIGTGTAASLGGGSSYNPATGTITKPTYALDGNTFTDVGQALAAVDAKATTGSVNGVVYDTSAHDVLTLGGTGATTPTLLTNVAPGQVSATSTDAVNGSQLFTTNQNVTNLGDTVNNITNGGAGIKYFHANSTLADSQAIGTDAVAIGGNANASALNSVALGSNSTTTSNLSAAAFNPTSTATLAGTASAANGEVSIGSAGKERRLTNVAAGAAPTDAVNVSQLQSEDAKVNGIGAGTAASLGGGSTYNTTTGAITKPTYTLDGNTFTDVGQALSAVDAKATTGSVNGVVYDTSAHDQVTFGGTGATTPVKLSNVAAGTANSDAVNLQQLKELGAGFDSSGNVTGAFVAYDDTSKGSVTLGGAGSTTPVKLSNVAAGTANTDAVNLQQLKELGAGIDTSGNVTGAFVAYDDTSKGTLTLGGVGATTPTLITNVAPGQVNATSTDAVNGSQLFTTNQNVTNLGDTVNNITNGGAGIKYFHANSTLADSQAIGTDAVAIGGNANASALNSVALGANSTTTSNLAAAGFNPGSLALSGTASAANGEVSIGSAGKERRLTNVAAGAAPTDAVNVSQLQSEDAKVNGIGAGTAASLGGGSTYNTTTGAITKPTYTLDGNTFTDVGQALNAVDAKATTGSVNGVVYDTSAHDKLTLGGVGASTPTVITNLAPGQIGATSTDAVNGSQLFATNQNVINVANTVNNITNNGAGIKYFHANSKLADSAATGSDAVAIGGNAQAGANQAIAIGSNANASSENSLALGSGSKTTANLSAAGFNPGSLALSGIASTANGEVSFGSAGKERRLTNVAAGSAATDAVNVSQLQSEDAKVNGIGAGTAASLGGGSTYNTTTGAITKPTYTLDGNTFTDVGQALSAVDAKATTGSVNGVVYDTSAHDQVTFGGTGATTPVKLSNVAAGTANSDAVNLQQLKELGAGFDSSGNVTGAFVAYDDTSKGSVTLGGAGSTTPVKLSNVAAGTANTDAVNLQQLKELGAGIDTSGNVTGAFVAYDDTSKGTLTLGGVGATTPTLITNVAPGQVNATSTDAVNGSQLFTTNQNVTNLGDTVNNITNGGAGIKYFHANSTLADSQAIGVDAVAIGGNANASALNSVALGANSTTTSNLAAAGFNPGSLALSGTASAANGEVSIGSAGKERRLTNVAAGAAPTDAVNVSQLQSEDAKVNGIGAGTAASLGGGSTYNTTTGAITKPTYTLDGNTFTDVGQALTAVDAKATTGSVNGVVYDTSAHTQVTFGGVGATTPVKLSNVAAGTANSDAVNLQQLKELGAGFDSSGNVTGAFVAYDDTSKGTLTLGGVGATTTTLLTNLSPGQLSATSTDAVNGSQLFSTNQNVTNIANTVANITNGSGGIKYFHANSTLADSQATGTDSVAMGGNAKAGAANSVALGSNSVADRANSVSVGSAGNERQITNVAAGTANTDAVNVAQLKAAGLIDGNGKPTAAVVYDTNADGSVNKGSVTMGSSGSPTTIHNVAGGVATTDAVNVGQLTTAIGNVVATGGNPLFSANGNPVTEAAVSTGSKAVASGSLASATGANSTALGANTRATGQNTVALGAGAVADRDNTVSVGSAGNERQITNVAAATQSTDAVNLSQLNSALSQTNNQANNYTDQRVNQMQGAISDTSRKAYSGIAAATALAMIPDLQQGKNISVGIGGAQYQGYAATAIGVNARITENVMVKAGAGFSSAGNTYGIGASYQW